MFFGFLEDDTEIFLPYDLKGPVSQEYLGQAWINLVW